MLCTIDEALLVTVREEVTSAEEGAGSEAEVTVAWLLLGVMHPAVMAQSKEIVITIGRWCARRMLGEFLLWYTLS